MKELNAATVTQKVFIHDLKTAKQQAGSDEERNAELADVNDRLNKCKGDKSVLLEQHRHIAKQLDEQIKPPMISIQSKIASAKNIADRKLELLRTKFEDAYRGTMWLRRNRNLFKGKVYEPMILEVSVLVDELFVWLIFQLVISST